MDNFVEIANVDEIPVGRVKSAVVAGRRIAIYHTARGFFASDDTCPHRGGPLHEGDIIGNEIVCPWHLWSFDIETGLCGGNSSIRITKHELRIEGGRIFVRLNPVPEPSSSLL